MSVKIFTVYGVATDSHSSTDSAIRLVYDGGEDGLYSTVGLLGLCLASMATGIGSSAGLSAAVNGVSKSFGKRRGSAIAAVVSCFGLSAFACT